MRASHMTSIGWRIVVGAFIAASAAFVWALLSFTWSERHSSDWYYSPLVAGYAVLVASWFVLPIGGILGAFMPMVIRGCSRRRAFIRGFFLGICAGLFAAILMMVLIEWPDISGQAAIVDRVAWWQSVRGQFLGCLATMTPICAVWVGVWALLWSRRVWSNHQSPEPSPAAFVFREPRVGGGFFLR